MEILLLACAGKVAQRFSTMTDAVAGSNTTNIKSLVRNEVDIFLSDTNQ